MAPEVIKGQNYNEKVDIWSLGVITYMLISGRNPFPGNTKERVKQLICSPDPIDLETEKFASVSKPAKDFIMKAMCKDVKKRASAKQLLDHPWIKSMMSKKKTKEVKKDDQVQILQNLQNFAKANKFQKSILSIMMGLTSDKSELQRLKVAFQKLDVDQDGHISTEEIRAQEKELKVVGLGGKWNEVLK